MTSIKSRFQDMDVWKRGAAISGPLFQLADALERKRLYRFAEQLRAAVLSITNNIAEGSGSVSDIEFAHFLNISRRSVFEVANTLMILVRQGICSEHEVENHLRDLDEQSRMLLAFRRTLKA